MDRRAIWREERLEKHLVDQQVVPFEGDPLVVADRHFQHVFPPTVEY